MSARRGTNARNPGTSQSERAQRPADRTQAHVGRDTAEARESSIPFGWHVFRSYYPPGVVAAVESLFDDNALNIQTVMMLQAADCLRVREVLRDIDPAEDSQYLAFEKLAAAQLRHLRLMAERFGANASADNQLVQVPLDLQMPLPFGERVTGDDNIVS
jgi:hypothetical protein